MKWTLQGFFGGALIPPIWFEFEKFSTKADKNSA